MAGHFEIIDAPDGGFRVRLLDGMGRLVATSVKYPTKQAAVAGISATREIAGTGLIRDMSRGGHGEPHHRQIQACPVGREAPLPHPVPGFDPRARVLLSRGTLSPGSFYPGVPRSGAVWLTAEDAD